MISVEKHFHIFVFNLFSLQGIFVSVIHCFMNVEVGFYFLHSINYPFIKRIYIYIYSVWFCFSSKVQTCIRNAYLRAAIRRNPNRRSATSLRLSRSSNSSQKRSPLPSRLKSNPAENNEAKLVIVVTEENSTRTKTTLEGKEGKSDESMAFSACRGNHNRSRSRSSSSRSRGSRESVSERRSNHHFGCGGSEGETQNASMRTIDIDKKTTETFLRSSEEAEIVWHRWSG